MALYVSAAFAQFNENVVNLDKQRTERARTSRDWLINQLKLLPTKADYFPNLYEGMHIKFGSFARNTKIRPLDDIDLMLTFSADGTTYTTYTYGKHYELIVPESNRNLWRLTNDDGTLNSRKVVNKILSSLVDIPQYSNAEIHRKGEAATLKLSSYEWNFDIVPAFFTDTGYYLIPDRNGNWKASDPRIDQSYVTRVNQKHNGLILQIIRLLKYWQRRGTMPFMPSYLFEIFILEYFDTLSSISKYIDVNLINFWHHLSTRIYRPVNDPAGFSGELNNLSYEDKTRISERAALDHMRGSLAFEYETVDIDHKKSINKWAEIFGEEFPDYG
jgi:hypothetical protein